MWKTGISTGYFHCQEAQQVESIWTQSIKSLHQVLLGCTLSSCYQAVSWTLPIAHNSTGHIPTILNCHLPSAFIDNSYPCCHSPLKTSPWQLRVDSIRSQCQGKSTKCTLKSLRQYLLPLEKETVLTLLIPWVLHSPSSRTLNGLTSHHWAANISENLEFGNIFTEKSKDSKHKKNILEENKQLWRTVRRLRHSLCHWAKQQMRYLQMSESNTITLFTAGLFTTKDSFSGMPSHCSLIWRVTCPRLISKLKEKERFHERCHYT